MYNFPGIALNEPPNVGDVVVWDGVRWVPSSGSAAAQAVSDWYVDPVNGSDTNDGLSTTSAFESYEPLNRLIGGWSTVLRQDTTIHVLNDIPDNALPFVFHGMIVDPFFLRLRQENPTILGTFTLGAVQNIVVNATFPTIQLNPPIDFTTAGPGGTSLEGVRFRKISGPGSANVGTIFWLEEVTPGDPTICYVNRPQFANPPFFATNESLATNDVYIAEALGVIGKHAIVPQDNQVINFAANTSNVAIENGRGVLVENQDQASAGGGDVNGTGGVCYHGCHINYGRLYADFTNIQACRWGRTAGPTALYTRRLVYFTGCSVQQTLQFGGNGEFQTYNNPSFARGGKLSTEATAGVPTYLFWDSPGFREWSGPALSLSRSQGRMRQRPWGTSTVANSYGVDISAAGRWTYDQAPTVSGAAAFDYDIGGLQNTYAGGPLPVINPANGAMLVVTN